MDPFNEKILNHEYLDGKPLYFPHVALNYELKSNIPNLEITLTLRNRTIKSDWPMIPQTEYLVLPHFGFEPSSTNVYNTKALDWINHEHNRHAS